MVTAQLSQAYILGLSELRQKGHSLTEILSSSAFQAMKVWQLQQYIHLPL